MSDNKIKLSILTTIGFNVNGVIANGFLEKISFNDIYSVLDNGTLFEFLDYQLPNQFDFSLFNAMPEQKAAFLRVINDIALVNQGNESRKLCVSNTNHGLSLLVAFIFEAINRRDWIS